MSKSRAWLRQANSDLASVWRLLNPHDESLNCQAAAKCQQTVEKAVKGLLAALDDAGFLGCNVGRRHDVDRYLALLVRRARFPGEIQRGVNLLFNHQRREEIRAIERLIPRWTEPGLLAARNSEYPYQPSADVWAAPADPGVFLDSEIELYRKLAYDILRGCEKLVSALQRGLG